MQLVDHVQHVLAGAVVADQPHQPGAGLLAPLAVHLDVGVAEPVDALKLVSDQEQPLARHLVDQLALQPVGVLELVHHHLGEPLAVDRGQLGRGGQQVARRAARDR